MCAVLVAAVVPCGCTLTHFQAGFGVCIRTGNTGFTHDEGAAHLSHLASCFCEGAGRKLPGRLLCSERFSAGVSETARAPERGRHPEKQSHHGELE